MTLDHHLDTDEVMRLRLLRKAAIILLLMIRLDPHPTGEAEIAEILEIHKATVRGYLRSLAQLGLVERLQTKLGYLLTSEGREFLLPGGGLIEPGESEPAQSARIARNQPPTTTTVNSYFVKKKKTEIRSEEEEGLTVGPDGAKNPPKNPLYADNQAAFRRCGVGNNHTVHELCEREGVTPEYIAGQAERLRREGRLNPGLLVRVVQAGDPLPEEMDEEAEKKREEKERHERYTGGIYSEFLIH